MDSGGANVVVLFRSLLVGQMNGALHSIRSAESYEGTPLFSFILTDARVFLRGDEIQQFIFRQHCGIEKG